MYNAKYYRSAITDYTLVGRGRLICELSDLFAFSVDSSGIFHIKDTHYDFIRDNTDAVDTFLLDCGFFNEDEDHKTSDFSAFADYVVDILNDPTDDGPDGAAWLLAKYKKHLAKASYDIRNISKIRYLLDQLSPLITFEDISGGNEINVRIAGINHKKIDEYKYCLYNFTTDLGLYSSSPDYISDAFLERIEDYVNGRFLDDDFRFGEKVLMFINKHLWHVDYFVTVSL